MEVTAVAVPRLSNEAARRQALATMRRRATGMLVFMTVVFVVARMAEEDGGAWVGYVRATAEAAMVGGLADWFAVTAMFRHPLGVPIPHTAIIPNRKDQIGAQPRRVPAGQLPLRTGRRRPGARPPGRGPASPSGSAGPGSAATVARHAADAFVAVTDALDDEEIQGAIEDLVVTPAADHARGPASPGGCSARSPRAGRHHELVDAALRGARSLPRRAARGAAGPVRPGVAVVGPRVDRRPRLREARRRAAGVHRRGRRRSRATRLRASSSTPASPTSSSGCSTTPTLIARGEAFKEELLGHPELRTWTASLWTDAKAHARSAGRRSRLLAAHPAREGGDAASATGWPPTPRCRRRSTPA